MRLKKKMTQKLNKVTKVYEKHIWKVNTKTTLKIFVWIHKPANLNQLTGQLEA